MNHIQRIWAGSGSSSDSWSRTLSWFRFRSRYGFSAWSRSGSRSGSRFGSWLWSSQTGRVASN